MAAPVTSSGNNVKLVVGIDLSVSVTHSLTHTHINTVSHTFDIKIVIGILIPVCLLCFLMFLSSELDYCVSY